MNWCDYNQVRFWETVISCATGSAAFVGFLLTVVWIIKRLIKEPAE